MPQPAVPAPTSNPIVIPSAIRRTVILSRALPYQTPSPLSPECSTVFPRKRLSDNAQTDGLRKAKRRVLLPRSTMCRRYPRSATCGGALSEGSIPPF